MPVLLCGWWLLSGYSHQADESPEADDGCPERPREIGDPASQKPAAEERELGQPEQGRQKGKRNCDQGAHESLLGGMWGSWSRDTGLSTRSTGTNVMCEIQRAGNLGGQQCAYEEPSCQDHGGLLAGK